MKAINILLLSILFFTSFSCKKFLEVGHPSTQLTGQTIFSSDMTATSVMLAIYSSMESDGIAYNLILNTGISSDECNNHRTSADPVSIANNNITPENGIIGNVWRNFYRYIYQCNAIIEGLEKSSSVSAGIKRQLLGEAKFIRAWCHFYLVNLFRNIPYNHVTDYSQTTIQPQQQAATLYPILIGEVKEAASLLSTEYLTATGTTGAERVRPNKWAAKALLARMELYAGNWNEAVSASTEVIQSGTYSISNNLSQVFLKNSQEAIWQLQAVVPRFNSFAGAFLQPTNRAPTLISLSRRVIDSFESGDKRKITWTKTTVYNGNTYEWTHKYKVGQNADQITEYTMVLRLAELFLIRAEANAQLNKLTEAEADINTLRTRAGLQPFQASNKVQLLAAIEKERLLELFAEFGDRWLNLKRSGRINIVMPAAKGNNWHESDQWYPIPLTEMLRHPGMVQNPGY